MFGGMDVNNANLGDTLSFNGTTWTNEAPATAPSARNRAGIVGADGLTPFTSVMLFGGSGGGAHNDTWVWGGVTWTQLFPATPPPVCYSAQLAYWGNANKVLLFHTNGNTYTWDGTNWTLESPTSIPGQRSGQAFGSTPDGKVLMFGGDITLGSGSWTDTWVWDGDWTQVYPITSPVGGIEGVLSNGYMFGNQYLLYDEFAAVIGVSTNETWQWDATLPTWNQLLVDHDYNYTGDNPVIGRPGCAGTYAFNDRFVRFGGTDEGSGLVSSDTYVLDLTPIVPPGPVLLRTDMSPSYNYAANWSADSKLMAQVADVANARELLISIDPSTQVATNFYTPALTDSSLWHYGTVDGKVMLWEYRPSAASDRILVSNSDGSSVVQVYLSVAPNSATPAYWYDTELGGGATAPGQKDPARVYIIETLPTAEALIYTNLVGAAPTTVLPAAGNFFEVLDQSSDGTRFIYNMKTTGRLGLANNSGTVIAENITGPGVSYNAKFSPDGTKVVVNKSAGAYLDIYDSATGTLLFADIESGAGLLSRSIAWLDNTRLILANELGTSNDVWTINYNGTGATQVIANVADTYYKDFVVRGGNVYVVRYVDTGVVGPVDLVKYADGTWTPTVLATMQYNDSNQVYYASPDGNWLTWNETTPTSDLELWVVRT